MILFRQRFLITLAVGLGWVHGALGQGLGERQLITVDPGHFHAALFQKEHLAGLSDHARIYAPLGPDLVAHLGRLAQFNTRELNPTHWQLEVYAGDDYWDRFLTEPAGQVVVISGRNRSKIDRIFEMARRGQNVLADKPWIIEPGDCAKLEAALGVAERKGVVVYDAMTQRFEISCLLQKALVQDPEIFGEPLSGAGGEPAVTMESMHCLFKTVAGIPSLRPAWFFDISQQGEGLADVGTHLVDLVQWTLFPEQAIDYRRDIRLLQASRWPTVLTQAQFERVTGAKAYPSYLRGAVTNGQLFYYANNRVEYSLRGCRVELTIRWDFEATERSRDYEIAVFRGSRSRVEVRPDTEHGFRPEVYVVPNPGVEVPRLGEALKQKIARLQTVYPGLAIELQGQRFHLLIPDALRLGHEEHFALLSRQFLAYVNARGSMPSWEAPNLLAKYYITTEGVALARKNGAPAAPPLENLNTK